MNENIQNNNGVNNNTSVNGATSAQPVLQPVTPAVNNQTQAPVTNPVVVEPTLEQSSAPVIQPLPHVSDGNNEPVVQPLPTVTEGNAVPVVQPLPAVAENAAPVVQPLPAVADGNAASVVPSASGDVVSKIGNIPLDQIKPREEQFAEIPNEGGNDNTPVEQAPAPKADEGAIVNENLKKVEIEYKPPSKVKTFGLIFLFVMLIAFVIFLPDISNIISQFQSKGELEEKVVITTGRLSCDLNNSTTNLDKNYEYTFTFKDSKLEKSDLTITTRGDVSLDETELNQLASSCREIEDLTKSMKGFSVSCDYSVGKLVERQIYDLQNVDMEQVTSAFTESGGSHPEYLYGEDINLIERNMISSGYSCRRQR